MLIYKKRFDAGIQRIRNLDSTYLHLIDNLKLNEEDFADILRSEVVYCVSIFDKFIHDVVKHGMIEIFLGTRASTNSYKNFTISLDQLQAITTATLPPAEIIFENNILQAHSHLSFQDPDKITPALSLIWNETHKWYKIATDMGENESNVKVTLKNIVLRRNQIVHEGDLDASTGDLLEIKYSDVETMVNFIEKLANSIYKLIL